MEVKQVFDDGDTQQFIVTCDLSEIIYPIDWRKLVQQITG